LKRFNVLNTGRLFVLSQQKKRVAKSEEKQRGLTTKFFVLKKSFN